MPAFLLGGVGNPNIVDDREYATYQRIAVLYLLEVLGPPPEGSAVEVICAEHASGSYQVIALTYEREPAGAQRYKSRAEWAILNLSWSVDWPRVSRSNVTRTLEQAGE